MSEKRYFRLKVLVGLLSLLMASLACVAFESTWCVYWQGGDWIRDVNHASGTGGCCKTATNKCESSVAKHPPDSDQESPDSNDLAPSAQACNATQYLSATGANLEQETNQFGTRMCKYSLRITNTHSITPIRYYVYKHDRDGYQHTEGYLWMGGLSPLAPGTGTDWPGKISIHTDKDFDGPSMSIPEKVAGIFDTPECSVYYKVDKDYSKFDQNFLESIAVPVSSACPLE
ncbi:MAG: hypothetical protein HN390_14610 [Anaerolineae bacterium]|nr:hypothetical protein [Anaerolineae bacterium]MBT7190232.1 hypothetical protein [Anaerolineae bacterium]MBT7989760.1 hypothetical protein [Anaerolineae bacterium]